MAGMSTASLSAGSHRRRPPLTEEQFGNSLAPSTASP